MKISDIYHYIIGNWRYYLYYSPFFKSLLRPHIKEQYEYRLNLMDKQCYSQGSCKMCGCTTTKLQMANKSCDKPCYPPMLSKKNWKKYKKGEWYVICKGKKFEIHKITNLTFKYGNKGD